MPQITSNFIFRSKLPNFERDSFDTLQAMRDVDPSWIDEGHISYCKANGIHYKFSQGSGWDANTGYWRILTPEDLVLDGYISREELDQILNEKWNEIDASISDMGDEIVGSIDDKLVEVESHWVQVASKSYASKDDIKEYAKVADLEDNYLTKLEGDNRYLLKSDVPEDDGYITKVQADDLYISQNDINDPKSDLTKKISSQIQAEVSNNYPSKNELNKEYATKNQLEATRDDVRRIDGILDQMENDIPETYATKVEVDEKLSNYTTTQELEDKYFTADEVNEKIDAVTSIYKPSDDIKQKKAWVATDVIDGLEGKSSTDPNIFGEDGAEISYAELFERIIFNRSAPEFIYPSCKIGINDESKYKDYWEGAQKLDNGDIYILKDIKDGLPKNDSLDIAAKNGTYSWKYKLDENGNPLVFDWTNNLTHSNDNILDPTSPTSTPVCSLNPNADLSEWVDTVDPKVGDIVYYRYKCYFNPNSDPILNNHNEELEDLKWDVNQEIYSPNKVIIEFTNSAYAGDNRLPLRPYREGENFAIVDLQESAIATTEFTLPSVLKRTYIAFGDSFVEEIDGVNKYVGVKNGDIYTYSYKANEYGHRGPVKIKVLF